jgi:hypothetical protein
MATGPDQGQPQTVQAPKQGRNRNGGWETRSRRSARNAERRPETGRPEKMRGTVCVTWW